MNIGFAAPLPLLLYCSCKSEQGLRTEEQEYTTTATTAPCVLQCTTSQPRPHTPCTPAGTPYIRRELEMPAAALHHAGVHAQQVSEPRQAGYMLVEGEVCRGVGCLRRCCSTPVCMHSM